MCGGFIEPGWHWVSSMFDVPHSSTVGMLCVRHCNNSKHMLIALFKQQQSWQCLLNIFEHFPGAKISWFMAKFCLSLWCQVPILQGQTETWQSAQSFLTFCHIVSCDCDNNLYSGEWCVGTRPVCHRFTARIAQCPRCLKNPLKC